MICDDVQGGFCLANVSRTVMLRYKCDFAGATFAEVNEAFSTQICSACHARSGPKGIAGLGIRAWSCGACGTVHDRNVNAAKNILAAGRRRLAEGIPAIYGAGGRQPLGQLITPPARAISATVAR
jgi:putative transposase